MVGIEPTSNGLEALILPLEDIPVYYILWTVLKSNQPRNIASVSRQPWNMTALFMLVPKVGLEPTIPKGNRA